MPSASKLEKLIAEFGDAAEGTIRDLYRRLGSKASAAAIRKGLEQKGFKPIRGLSDNPASRAVAQAATRPRTTEQPTRRPPPVEELAVKPGRAATMRAKPLAAKPYDIPVYHGTTKDFEALDPLRARAGLGAYATPNRDFAAEFAQGDGRVISGNLQPEKVVDLSDFGAFPEQEALRDIAANIGADPDAISQVYRDLAKQQGDVHMFSLLENAGVEIPERTAWKFQDWGQGAPEPAYVFSDPALFARGDAAASAVEELAVKPGRKGFETRFEPPSKKPVVTQAGEMGLPVSGAEQMAVAHPSPFGAFATVKPRRRASEVTSEYLPAEEFGPPTPGRNTPLAVFDPDAPRKSFAVEDLENAMAISLLGDRMSAGRRITDIDGTPVNVMTYGGPRYGEFNEAMGSPAVWASERAPISSLRDKIRGGLEEGRDVYGVYTAMGPRSLDQTTMMTDALLQQARAADIKKQDAEMFNEAMRGVVPDFVGLQDPGAYQQLASLPQGQRLQFTQLMDNAKLLGAGFPDVSATRIALTEPELLNAPAGSSGFSVMKLGPESLEDFEISLPHPTYPVQMAGETAGRFPEMVPLDMIFSDLVSERRGAGASAGKDLRALELRRPSQVVAPEQLERLLKYLDDVGR